MLVVDIIHHIYQPMLNWARDSPLEQSLSPTSAVSIVFNSCIKTISDVCGGLCRNAVKT
jgi:hypothetical protein